MTTQSMLPPQAAPIDRTPAGAAAFANDAGVESSGIWDVLGDAGGAALHAGLGSILGSI